MHLLYSFIFLLFSEGMAEYFNRNKCLPSKVFLYRDGVGEGQIPVVFNLEVQQVLHTLKEVAIHFDQCVYLFVVTIFFSFQASSGVDIHHCEQVDQSSFPFGRRTWQLHQSEAGHCN